MPTNTAAPGMVSSTNAMPSWRSILSGTKPQYNDPSYGEGVSMYFRASTISAAIIVVSPDAIAASSVGSSTIFPLASPSSLGRSPSLVQSLPSHAKRLGS